MLVTLLAFSVAGCDGDLDGVVAEFTTPDGVIVAEITTTEPTPPTEPVIPPTIEFEDRSSDLVGFKFDHNIDLGEMLAGRKPRHGFRSRPPRLEIACKASVRIGKLDYTCDVHDISLDGMKVEPIEEYCVGKKVVVVVESLKPVKGEVRWYSDRRAGIVFDESLDFDELAEWCGKRLELAKSLATNPRLLLLDEVNAEDKGCTEKVYRGLCAAMSEPGHLSHLERPNFDFACYLNEMIQKGRTAT